MSAAVTSADAAVRPTAASRWTPARIFLAASAVFHVPVGVVGLLYDRTFPIGAQATASSRPTHLFGILETNGWHTLGALFVGIVSLYFAIRSRRARDAALAIGFGHVGLVAALILWEPSTFWIASNAADQIVHLTTAVGGIVSGLLTPAHPQAVAVQSTSP